MNFQLHPEKEMLRYYNPLLPTQVEPFCFFTTCEIPQIPPHFFLSQIIYCSPLSLNLKKKLYLYTRKSSLENRIPPLFCAMIAQLAAPQRICLLLTFSRTQLPSRVSNQLRRNSFHP